MRSLSGTASARSNENVRGKPQSTEESFGSVLTDIAELLFPAPNTAAQIAAELDCSVRNIEAALSGRQKWSGTAVAFLVAEICRRHAMRNIKITAR